MKRFLFGLALLGAVLLLCLWNAREMQQLHMPVTQALNQAGTRALEGDLDQGIRLAREAKARWEAGRKQTAAVMDQTPMEQIDSLFAQLEGYAQGGLQADFAALCGRISRLVEAVAEASELHWWTFF